MYICIYVYIYIYTHITYIHTYCHVPTTDCEHYTLLHCTALHCTIPYCTILYYTILYYTITSALYGPEDYEFLTIDSDSTVKHWDLDYVILTCIIIIIIILRYCSVYCICCTPNLPTNIVDFRGLDSSTISMLKGGILRHTGIFPESLSQAMLVDTMLVGRLGVCNMYRASQSLYNTITTYLDYSVVCCYCITSCYITL